MGAIICLPASQLFCSGYKGVYDLAEFADDAGDIANDEFSRFEDRVWALTNLASGVSCELGRASDLVKQRLKEPRSEAESRIVFDEFRKFHAALRLRLEERVAASKLNPEDAAQIMAYINPTEKSFEVFFEEARQPESETVEL